MLLPRVLACTRSQLAPLSTRHSMARLPPLAAHRARMLSDATSKAAGDAAASAEAAAEAAAEPAKEASEAGAAEEEAAEDPIAQLEARVSELDKELAEKHDQMLRALAEADNARRRARLDVENSHKFGVSKFAKDLLEVADNLSRAADSVPEEMRSSDEHPVLKALYEGVIMTDDQLVKTFGKHGASSSSPPLRPSTRSTTRRPPRPKLILPSPLSRAQASPGSTLSERSSTPTSMCGAPLHYARSADSTLATSTSSCLPPNPLPHDPATLPVPGRRLRGAGPDQGAGHSDARGRAGIRAARAMPARRERGGREEGLRPLDTAGDSRHQGRERAGPRARSSSRPDLKHISSRGFS